MNPEAVPIPWETTIEAILSSRWLRGALPVMANEITEEIGCPVSVASRIIRGIGWERRRVSEIRGWWPPGVTG
jgi:hypothetical protein